MALPRFALARPDSLAEAVALLAENGDEAAVYAGGTELLLTMKQRVARYAWLVDIKRVPGLAGVSVDEAGGLAIGALTSHRVLERDPLVRERLPAYAELSRHVGNVRVRAAGTLGGNLCFAEPHADPPTLLCALDARLALTGPAGARECTVAEFIVGAYETTRRPGELLTRVIVPPAPPGRRVAYERFGHLERPTIVVAAVLDVTDDGRAIARARVWIGAIGPRPVAARRVEERLTGRRLGGLAESLGEIARDAGEESPVDADLHGSEDYKRHLAGVLVERALRRALHG